MIWTLPALYDGAYLQRAGNDISYTTITADATTHVKGAWTEIIPADAYDIDVAVVVVRITNVAVSGSNTAMLVDLGIGASGSEQVWIPDMLAGGGGGTPYWIPLYLPAGTRISARCQAMISADTASVNVDLYLSKTAASHPFVYHGVENCGANPADSDGVGLTVGSWVTLKAATDYDAVAAVPMFAVGGNVAGADNLVDFGIGAASSEQVLIEGVKVTTNSTELISFTSPTGLLPMDFRAPAGTRIAARRGGDRALDGALLLLR
jgi:hypothetical protein